MSISTDSTNSGEFSSDDYEMNYDELSIVKEGAVVKTNSETFIDRQKLKELNEKFGKIELVLKITKLELKNKGLQEKLKEYEMSALLAKIEAENGKMKNEIEKMQAKMDEKEKQLEKKEEQLEKKEKQYMEKLEELQKNMLQVKCDAEEENRKLRNEHKEMKEKMDKLEEKLGEKLEKLDEEQKIFQEEHEKKLMEQIVKVQTKVDNMEMEKQKQKVSIGQIEQLQNEQKRKNNALEMDKKENQIKMALLNFRQNYWDVNACHNDLEITELTVHCHEGVEAIRTVFATHPFLFDKDFSNIFYFEISVKKILPPPIGQLTFGFAVKKHKKLEGTIYYEFGTYAYLNQGAFAINGEVLYQKEQRVDCFKQNDIVGCGINSATRQIFFTKNGRRQGPFYLVDNSPYSAPDELFPFVTLCDPGDESEANFGPNFKFNLATI